MVFTDCIHLAQYQNLLLVCKILVNILDKVQLTVRMYLNVLSEFVQWAESVPQDTKVYYEHKV